MKRFLAFLLTLCLILTLCACGDSKDETPATTPKATEAVEPEVTEPEFTEPEETEPEVTEPEVTEPEVTTEPVILEMVVEEVVEDGENSLEKLSMAGAVASGSIPWMNGDDTCDKAIDGDISTFFDAVENGWLEIDFGGIASFNVIGFSPRNSFLDRMIDGTFYVSNDGVDWTPVYTVESRPAYKMNFAYLDKTYDCRYIRYDIPSGQRDNGENYIANIAEVAIYRTPGSGSEETAADAISEETVLELLKKEYELNRYLFCGYMRCGGNTKGSPEYPGKKLYNCTEEDKDEWSEWEAYVNSICCGEASKAALSSPSIVNIDGQTYSDWDSDPWDPDFSDSFTIALKSSDADKAVYTVTAAALADPAVTKDCEYTFENTPDGWRISSVVGSWSLE